MVFHSEVDLYHLHGISRKSTLLCSDVVNWLSEFRVYVVHGKILHIAHYSGDKAITPSESVINEAIRQLIEAGEAFDGFCIDFGVLSSGETALIEMNDGYAIGAYPGLGCTVYGDLIFARWKQLVNGAS